LIQTGDRGPLVRAWQRIVGLGPSKADGVFGPGTEAAVNAWKVTQGLTPDGVLDVACRTLLDPACLVRPYEGLVLQAYDDERRSPLSARLLHRVGGTWIRADGRMCEGTATIGWGSTEPCRRGIESCTRAEADQWLQEYIDRTAMPAVVRAGITDAAQVAALVGLAYNAGPGAIPPLAQANFAPDYWLSHRVTAASAPEIVDAGLLMRRSEEAALFWDVLSPA
jgi:GH24 family phage-related lysozyme (muramidase)